MVTTKLNLSMTEPQVRQIYAKQGDAGRVLDITLDQTPEDGTLRILRPDGVEVTSEAVTGGEVESGSTFESLTEADVTELTVGIEPVQDLNGYDKPWVGGAGVNIIGDFALANSPTPGGEITATRQSDGSTYVLNGTATATRDVYILPIGSYPLEEGEYSAYAPTGTGINGTSNYFYIVVYNGTSSRYIGAGGTSSSSSFTIASGEEVRAMFIRVGAGVNTTGKIVTPMIVKGTTAPTSYSPYSNICPITGHDEVTVTRTGKNLLNLNVTSKTQNGITFTVNADGSIKVNGTATSGNAYFTKTTGAPPKMTKGTTVTLSGVEGSTTNQLYLQLIYIGADGSTISITSVSGATTYTFAQDATFSAYWLTVRQGATHDNTMVYPQLELGSTATSYEPYNSNTYTTSLGQTVYGGTLDMVTGVLTVDRAMVDLGSLTLSYDSGNRVFQTATVLSKSGQAGEPTYMVSDRYESMPYGYNSAYTDQDGVIWLHPSGTLRVRNLAYTDATDFKTAMSGSQLVYLLATPQIYQLTAQQIKTLVGTNNVWASSGDIVNITFTYGGLLSELPSDATSVVGKCYCDVEQNGVSSMPFTLNVKKNERES